MRAAGVVVASVRVAAAVEGMEEAAVATAVGKVARVRWVGVEGRLSLGPRFGTS